MKKQVWCDPELDVESDMNDDGLGGCRGIVIGVLISMVIWLLAIAVTWMVVGR